MANKIPKEIKLGSRTIAVEITKIDPQFMGLYLPDEQKIQINSELSPSLQVETFWHELIHAINDYNRVTVEIATELEKQDPANAGENAWNLEERMTENFAKAFIQVIQDNNLLKLTN